MAANFSSQTSHSPRSGALSATLGLILGVGLVAAHLMSQNPMCLDGFLLGFEDDKVAESDRTITDPSTALAFPTTITFKSPASPPLSLLGVGVRTVSFLGIQVYACGFYADLNRADLNRFSTSEEKLNYLIENKAVAIRLVAVRNTNFSHLRDAYIRALQGRLTASRKDATQQLEETQEEAIQGSLQRLKGTFPTSSLKKHVPFYLLVTEPQGKNKDRVLHVPTLQGTIEDSWVGTELMRYYFIGDGPSPKMKKSVMDRLGGN